VSTSDVLDPAAVAELRRVQEQFGNPEFIGELVGLFRKNAPRRMSEIRAALAARDGASLQRAAHTLKTNCAFVGAKGMAEACARIEDAAGRGDFDAAAPALTEAELLFPEVLAAVLELGARG